MTAYVIKRILLMIPTLFLIVLITFVVLNFAPGEPGRGQMNAQGTESAQDSESRESYRIFKEQFNLDKPVLINTRYGLSADRVARELEIIADSVRPICPEAGGGPEDCLPRAERPESAQIINAYSNVEDWGEYVVHELYEVGKNHDRLDVRRLAVNQLATNAQFDLINEYGENQGPDQKAFNQWADDVNRTLEKWTVAPDAGPDQVDKVLTDKWKPYLDEGKPFSEAGDIPLLDESIPKHFQFSFGEKLSATFFDTRFAKYLGNVATLNFGVSHVNKQPVLPQIIDKASVTIVLSFLSVFLSYLISLPLGIWSAYVGGSGATTLKESPRQFARDLFSKPIAALRQINWGPLADQTVTIILFMLYSLPTFFVGVLLLLWLTIDDGQAAIWYDPSTWLPVKLFPTGGFIASDADQMTTLEQLQSVAWHVALPVYCLTYRGLASLSRYARTGLLDVINADYIRTARAKGLSESVVILKHAVRNGMIPVLTLLGTLLPFLIGGSIVLEIIFNIPGMGLYLFDSIFQRDYNVIMGVLLISAVLTLIGLLISDISYAVVDPRISFD